MTKLAYPCCDSRACKLPMQSAYPKSVIRYLHPMLHLLFIQKARQEASNRMALSQ